MTPRRTLSPPTARPRVLLAAAVALALVVAACGGDDDTGRGPTDPPAATVVDWTARTVTVDGGAFAVAFCEGEGPFLCFSRAGEVVGTAELVDFPTTSHDIVTGVHAEGGSDLDALRALATDFVTHFTADRAEGCGPDYVVTGDTVSELSVGGHDGLRYGFSATREGQRLERVVQYSVIDGDTLFLLTAGGLEPESCLPREGEFTVADLEAALPVLDRIATGSRLPARDHEDES